MCSTNIRQSAQHILRNIFSLSAISNSFSNYNCIQKKTRHIAHLLRYNNCKLFSTKS